MKTCWHAMLAVLFALIMSQSSVRAEESPEAVSLFDGQTLEGWDGDPRFWSVEDGAITGQTTSDNPTEHNTFLIWRDGKPGDFRLELDFRIVGGNSGIQYRSREVNPDEWIIGGYQADFDAPGRFAGILYEERGRGILARTGDKVKIGPDGKKQVVDSIGEPEKIRGVVKKEKWNHYTIIAKGNHLVHKINDVATVEVIDNQVDKRKMSGLIALQLHQGPPMKVQFKNIQLIPAKD